jgi:putative endonuclease
MSPYALLNAAVLAAQSSSAALAAQSSSAVLCVVVLGLDPRTHLRLKRGVAYYVYMLASRHHGTLYIGVTNDLVRRVHEHRCHAVPGFTRRYHVERLVWFEPHDDIGAAIRREKSLKRWLRAWKVALIEQTNPTWRDLFDEIAA